MDRNFFLVFTLALLFGTSTRVYSQYNLSIGSNYVYAFGDRSIDFQDETFSLNSTQGFEITVNNSCQFVDTKISAVFEVGFRQLYFSGNSEILRYSGQLNKLIGALGVNYSFTDKFEAAAYIEAENNLEFDYFYSETGDLFRISLSLESTCYIIERLGITLLLSRAMTPITNAYIITNPQYQARLGLIYQFLK
ncbi:MAG: hypothetical protein P8P74_05730 [Crocinitomicaceae bacterium]|nr:hypothetical protein [Crocinitomicaceae bacterium]